MKSKAASSKADNKNEWMATNGTLSDEYRKDAFKEIENLEGMEFWEAVDRAEELNVIN